MFKFSSHVKVHAASPFPPPPPSPVTTPQEEHGQPLFGVQFNWYLEEDRVFASVGGNRVQIQLIPSTVCIFML